jgi:ABC-type microcin C transport system permease subunit YejE
VIAVLAFMMGLFIGTTAGFFGHWILSEWSAQSRKEELDDLGN